MDMVRIKPAAIPHRPRPRRRVRPPPRLRRPPRLPSPPRPRRFWPSFPYLRVQPRPPQPGTRLLLPYKQTGVTDCTDKDSDADPR